LSFRFLSETAGFALIVAHFHLTRLTEADNFPDNFNNEFGKQRIGQRIWKAMNWTTN
jgi:hypothetical protein